MFAPTVYYVVIETEESEMSITYQNLTTEECNELREIYGDSRPESNQNAYLSVQREFDRFNRTVDVLLAEADADWDSEV